MTEPAHHRSSTVFVYGTLRPGEANFAALRDVVSPAADAVLHDHRLLALPAGYPTIVPGDGRVVGTVLRLDDRPTAWRIMDRIEGYDPDADNPLYRPLAVDVEEATGESIETITYVLTADRRDRLGEDCTLVDHGDWVRWSTNRECR